MLEKKGCGLSEHHINKEVYTYEEGMPEGRYICTIKKGCGRFEHHTSEEGRYMVFTYLLW